jgi:hypothetical protein
MVNMAKIRITVLTILTAMQFLTASWLQAEAQFYAQVDPESGTLDTIYNLNITLEDADATEDPVLEPSADFSVQYRGPISRVQIVQGEVSRQKTWVYALMPTKQGELKTPSATLTVNKERLRTEQIVVRVSAALATPIPQVDTAAPEGVLLRQTIDNRKVYVGQQIALSIDLLTAISLYEPQFPDLVYDGFIVRTVADNLRGSEVINGIAYDKLQFKRALFGLREGKHILGARSIKARVASQKEKFGKSFPFEHLNPFDMGSFEDFFAGRKLEDVSIDSNELELELLPLPPRPVVFPLNGLAQTIVGETTVEASLDRPALSVGETAQLRVVVTSTGNIAGIKGIQLPLDPSLQVYEEAAEQKEFEVGGLLVTQKKFPIAIVPTAGGQFVIPPYRLGYWDITTGSYREAQSAELKLKVAGPTISPPAMSAPPTETVNNSSDKSLKYAAPSLWERLSAWISIQLVIYFLAFLIIMSFAALVLLRSISKRMPKQNALRQLRLALEADQIKSVVYSYLAQRFSLSLEVRGAALREQLKEKGLSSANMFAIEALLDDLDAKLYGDDNSGLASAELRARAEALVRIL